MIDWKKIYIDYVTPVINNSVSPPPNVVLVVLAVVFLSGLALMLWTPLKGKLIGLVLVFIVSFVGYMVISNYFKAKNGFSHFKTGIVTKKIKEKVVRTNSQGYSYSDTIYYIKMSTSEAFILTKEGQGAYLPDKIGEHKLFIDNSLYDQLEEQEIINAVILPTGSGAINFVVRQDGSVLK